MFAPILFRIRAVGGAVWVCVVPDFFIIYLLFNLPVTTTHKPQQMGPQKSSWEIHQLHGVREKRKAIAKKKKTFETNSVYSRITIVNNTCHHRKIRTGPFGSFHSSNFLYFRQKIQTPAVCVDTTGETIERICERTHEIMMSSRSEKKNSFALTLNWWNFSTYWPRTV